MRYLKLFVITILMLLLTGCDKPVIDEPNDEKPPQTDLEFLEEAANSLEIPQVFQENYNFIKKLSYKDKTIEVSWKSNKVTSLSNFGIVKPGYQDEDVILTATFYYENEELKKEYHVVVPAMSTALRFENILRKIEIPNEISNTIELLTSFEDEEVKISWKSSHPDILTNDGVYQNPSDNTLVTLTIILELGSEKMEKTFEINVLCESEKKEVNNHLILDYAEEYNPDFLNDCYLENKKLVLNKDKLSGSYTSSIFELQNLTSLVASWGAITSKNATCEVEVRVMVDGVWSMYFSYGTWGLGLENKPMLNGSDDLAKLSTDEIIIKNGKYASAIQYRVTLMRDTLIDESPKLSFVALALDYDNYEYKIDTSKLPKQVDYDVPKLNQNVVPVIGNSICSPTSSTMLLKYKGHSFSEYDEYENRYIAYLSRDYGNELFGNWTYCTVIIASYDETAYVKRMYSLDELKEHLANIGPVALSVRGSMVPFNGDKGYKTDGHLLVCRGYYELNGKTIFICNDPNKKDVYVEYSEDVIKDVWRMVTYVVE